MNDKYKNNPEHKETSKQFFLENYFNNQEERKKKALEYYYSKTEMDEITG